MARATSRTRPDSPQGSDPHRPHRVPSCPVAAPASAPGETIHTPSRKYGPTCSAAACASRVFPTPSVPVTLTTRVPGSCSACLSAATASSRPIRDGAPEPGYSYRSVWFESGAVPPRPSRR